MNTAYIDGAMLKKLFIAGANSLEKYKEQVNALNVFPVPDGDTGTNMSLTLNSALKEVLSIDSDDIGEIGTAISKGSLMGARGNSGVILSQIFRGFAKGLQGKSELGVSELANACKMASDTAYKAVMKPIEGTILTVARECAQKAMELAQTDIELIPFIQEVIKHGEIVLDKTPDMLEVLKQAGVVDAGGKGLLIVIKGAYNVLVGKEDVDMSDLHVEKPSSNLVNVVDENIEFGYCTEFIIKDVKGSAECFRKEIMDLGDSLLVIGDGLVIKTHIHTNDPGVVLQKALQIGQLMDIKIENMRLQHQNTLFSDDIPKKEEVEMKEYGIVAVVKGKGIERVFEDLNVDYIIEGGQTMNPSTEDILKAVDSINAKNIIILPNNSNIILTAQQVKQISDKNIGIIPTKNIPQGVSALIAFDMDSDLEDNVENMTDAFSEIKSGEVTTAVRDTVMNDVEIKEGDIIGLYDGKIVKASKNLEETVFSTIAEMVDEDSDIITLFYGEDVSEEEANKLVERIEEEMDDLDVELVYGGQPLYYYLISVE